ncbi:hypothetical protein AQS8620_01762 [Aquimixticola soesokkakensis]|uniref:ATP-dependent transcriptional regulator n=1 Tax=Aquimixticola soesokkakensis TaxID=1519096 RepID=A0A1Y5SMQ4_9RHOB|nr:DUF2927 domain-containing protein [Aquimixticola soesokkakensis]SLN44163.1 hypothetical protein AQS8620_01762 [Aquimixticola soesokkakensis]
MSKRHLLTGLGAALWLAACGTTGEFDGDVASSPPNTTRAAAALPDLPPMKVFQARAQARPTRSNATIARDILELTFSLERGTALPVLTRFEHPVRVRVTGARIPASVGPDLDGLLRRLRAEAGIDITRVGPRDDADITIEMISHAALERHVSQAACFVAPNVSGWKEYLATRRSQTAQWTALTERGRLGIFIPEDTSPQEIRDCLHEELAQSLGPLNDLYRLTDSVFNDDNFHSVLTGFDMLVLKTIYDPALRSGMSRAQVAAALPAILARLNPAGGSAPVAPPMATPPNWTEAIQTALSATNAQSRKSAARRAAAIARANGWSDARAGFSLYVLGRMTIGSDPDLALTSFLQADALFDRLPDAQLHHAKVAMQLAAFTLTAGQPRSALDLADGAIPAARQAENGALLASLLMIKSEALALLGRSTEARAVQLDSLAWARYGFGSDTEVIESAAEIHRLAHLSR